MNDETLLSTLPERFLASDQASCPFGGLSFALSLSPTECESQSDLLLAFNRLSFCLSVC